MLLRKPKSGFGVILQIFLLIVGFSAVYSCATNPTTVETVTGSGDSDGGADGSGGTDEPGGSDTTPGSVSFNIADGATDVPVQHTFVATFTAPISTGTVTADSFFVAPESDVSCNASLAIAATVSCSSNSSCELTTNTPLTSGTDYHLCLTSAVQFAQPNVVGVFQGDSIGFTTHVAVVESLALSPTNVSFNVADTMQFAVTGTYDDTTTKTITDGLVWSSSNTNLVTVTQSGLATAIALGDTTLTVTHTSTGLTASTQVNVDFPIGGVFRYTVGGTISGLAGTVILQVNSDHDLSVVANGNFTFNTSIVDGDDYDVTVLTQPTGQTCVVTHGSGTLHGDNIETVVVTCTNDSATITVTGSPLGLIANGPTGYLTINNTSLALTATDIVSNFTGTALDGNITETDNTCYALPPGNSCTLTYTPGSNAVTQTSFSILGANTNTVTAAIAIGPPPPTLSQISPTLGSAAGGTGFSLTGTNLTGTTSVTFGGTAATSIYVVNATTVRGTTPAHSAATVNVVVTTSSGTATITNGYDYQTTAIGQSTGGGTVACLGGGLQNLIAAATDNSASLRWGSSTFSSPALSTTDGAANTVTITETLGTFGDVPYAAKLCSDYEIDAQNNSPCLTNHPYTCFDDWFLPATNQLSCLRTNQANIGAFSTNVTTSHYWSSTVDGSSIPLEYYFPSSNSSPGGTYGTGTNKVRCVRSFTP